MSRTLTWLLLQALQLYRASLSLLFGPACRFEPTCSRYAELALRQFGLAQGSWLAIRRLARCHPWGGSGYDPVRGSGYDPLAERANDGS